MAGHNVLTLTDDNFDAEVLHSAVPVLVDFGADWCMPCRMLAPTIDELAGEFAGKVKVAKVDIQNSPELASRFGIMNIPTVMVFKGGRAVATLVGQKSKKEYVEALNKVL